MNFEHPVIGQEALCPDGLGRVVAFRDEFPHQWIKVSTYVKDRGCEWAPHNVKLVPLAVEVQPDAQALIAELREERDALRAQLQAAAEQPGQMVLAGHQYQGRDGAWHTFLDERHYQNTLKDGTWPIRAIYTTTPSVSDKVEGE